MKLLISSFILFLVFGCKPQDGSSDKTKVINSSIVGGTLVDPSITDTSYIVNIGGNCAGSIIASKWILTAAHCEPVFNRLITAGSPNLDARKRIRLSVRNYFIHPKHKVHKWGDSYDFALIELKNPIDFELTKLSMIKLADPIFESEGGTDEGVMTTVLGWGATSEGGGDSSKLMKIEVPIKSSEKANAKNVYNGKIDDSMLVAGFDQGLKDSCQGDSGGPMIVANSAYENTLVGVVSFGEECASARYPGVYSKVSIAFDWITAKIK